MRNVGLNDNLGMLHVKRPEMGYWYTDDLHLMPLLCKNAVDWPDAIAALNEIEWVQFPKGSLCPGHMRPFGRGSTNRNRNRAGYATF